MRIVCDSHEISFLISFRNLGKMSQNLSSAAVVIGALRVKLDDVETTIQFKHVYFIFYEGFNSLNYIYGYSSVLNCF